MAELLDPDAMPSVLATLFATRHNTPDLVAGVNDDDCAVLRFAQPLLVVTTDYVNANPISIELDLGDVATIGRLAVAANLADLLGTGARPRCFLLSVVMPRDGEAGTFHLLAEGARAEAARWGVPIVGGDTKLGRAMAVCGVAIGEAASESELFLKHRARPGDDLWVSGQLGSCSAAVIGMTNPIIDAEWRAWARAVLTSPELPFEKSRAVAALASSCGGTDISDGLGTDLAQLCEASGVGAIVELGSIPIHPHAIRVAEDTAVPPWAMAFGVGGDFQFLVAAPPDAAKAIARTGMLQIGKVTASREMLVSRPNGTQYQMPVGGHRDGRRLTFADEVRYLVREACYGS